MSKTPRPGKRCRACWLDQSEYEAFLSRAADAGMTGVDWLRSRCLGAQPKRRRKGPDVQELHRIRGQIGKIGGHTNQLATVANDAGKIPALSELEQIKNQLAAIETTLARALGYGS